MASAGPLFPGFASNVNTIGTVAWSNLGNLYTEDAAFVTASLGAATSQYLTATSFGFSIPAGATIVGIVVEWKRKANGGMFGLKDNAVRIVKGGSVGTTDESSATAWTSTNAWCTYGGSSDLWGLTFSPSDINASNFGCALSAVCAGTDTASVDCCRITVYYTPAGGATGSVPARLMSMTRTYPAYLE